YDPIPSKDFYSLQGVFSSTQDEDFPLAAKEVVEKYQGVKKKIDNQKSAIADFINRQSAALADILAAKTSRYMIAAWMVMSGESADAKTAAQTEKLDEQTLERWIKYLNSPEKEHPFLKDWYATTQRKGTLDEVKKVAAGFEKFVLSVVVEQRQIEDRNYVKLGGAEGSKDFEKRAYTNLESLEIKKYYLWRDLASEPYTREAVN